MTVELCSKFCVDPYPKREFHEKSRVVDFSIAGHILLTIVDNNKGNKHTGMYIQCQVPICKCIIHRQIMSSLLANEDNIIIARKKMESHSLALNYSSYPCVD